MMLIRSLNGAMVATKWSEFWQPNTLTAPVDPVIPFLPLETVTAAPARRRVMIVVET